MISSLTPATLVALHPPLLRTIVKTGVCKRFWAQYVAQGLPNMKAPSPVMLTMSGCVTMPESCCLERNNAPPAHPSPLPPFPSAVPGLVS
ncbi:uncharacterized protein RCC_07189 [Ramularia collo-cygni]|uniref:Uncharacterized protein n=1 Tax=Ramularia collo-cygni TaxID=112498 RepID=A0A2D3V3Q4_9PEZI|nr:uncharacterized protein RCC_07189 [Ramularia collo-cygni]CZT21325.1 uncharacterized protein RCC_07189 [Ramularia collo-cygni]